MSVKHRQQVSEDTRFAVESQFQNALALHRQSRLADAEKAYEDILRKMPDHFGALNLLGVIACQNCAHERAVELISKAIAGNPNVPAAHSNLGVALKELKRPEEALASFDKAIALKPDYADAHLNRGLVLKELGRTEAAIASFDRSIALKPDSESFYNRGNALAELKRFEDAIGSYSEAIGLRPGHADAHLNRGNALKEIGRLQEALENYDRAIALKPDFAEALANRGSALSELERFEEALASYDKAIALLPDDPAAYSGKAIVLKEISRFDEALANCDRAMALQPGTAAGPYNRGIVLRELNRLEDAYDNFRQATLLKPDFSDAFKYMGFTLHEIGRPQEAEAALVRAIELDPRNSSAYHDLIMTKKVKPGDPHFEAMLQLLAEPDRLRNEDHICLNFALGKAYADLKDRRRSFEHFLAGNKARRATVSYDESASFAVFESIEEIFSRELIEAKSGGGDLSKLPIFILGMPRSGTTLIEQILASHPAVYGAGELRTLGTIADNMYRLDGAQIPYPLFVPSLDRSAFADMGKRYLAAVNERGANAERVTDKMPANFAYVGLIQLALPNAKIIHTIRDPLDTCISCFSKLFARGQKFSFDLGELGRHYKRYEHLMAHWRSVLPSGRMLEVQYEDVVADLETQARRILEYCELPWDDRCLSFHTTDRPVRTASVMQVRQPIYKSAVGRWRDHEEFLGPLFEALGISPDRGTAEGGVG